MTEQYPFFRDEDERTLAVIGEDAIASDLNGTYEKPYAVLTKQHLYCKGERVSGLKKEQGNFMVDASNLLSAGISPSRRRSPFILATIGVLAVLLLTNVLGGGFFSLRNCAWNTNMAALRLSAKFDKQISTSGRDQLAAEQWRNLRPHLATYSIKELEAIYDGCGLNNLPKDTAAAGQSLISLHQLAASTAEQSAKESTTVAADKLELADLGKTFSSPELLAGLSLWRGILKNSGDTSFPVAFTDSFTQFVTLMDELGPSRDMVLTAFCGTSIDVERQYYFSQSLDDADWMILRRLEDNNWEMPSNEESLTQLHTILFLLYDFRNELSPNPEQIESTGLNWGCTCYQGDVRYVDECPHLSACLDLYQLLLSSGKTAVNTPDLFRMVELSESLNLYPADVEEFISSAPGGFPLTDGLAEIATQVGRFSQDELSSLLIPLTLAGKENLEGLYQFKEIEDTLGATQDSGQAWSVYNALKDGDISPATLCFRVISVHLFWIGALAAFVALPILAWRRVQRVAAAIACVAGILGLLYFVSTLYIVNPLVLAGGVLSLALLILGVLSLRQPEDVRTFQIVTTIGTFIFLCHDYPVAEQDAFEKETKLLGSGAHGM